MVVNFGRNIHLSHNLRLGLLCSKYRFPRILPVLEAGLHKSLPRATQPDSRADGNSIFSPLNTVEPTKQQKTDGKGSEESTRKKW